MLRLFIALLLYVNLANAQLLNGGFEIRINSKLGSANWESFDDTSGLDSVDVASGKYCMRITGDSRMQSFAQKMVYKASAFEQLWLRAKIRAVEVHGNVGLLAIVTRPNGSQGYVNASGGSGIKSATNWVSFGIPVIVEPGENSMFVGGVIQGEGTAWFDDFELLSIPNTSKFRPKAVQKYVKEYKEVIRENALVADSIDIDEFDSIVNSLTQSASRKSDCYAAFEFGIKLLNDRHSSFYTPAMAREWKSESGKGSIQFPHGMMKQGVGYIRVPEFSSGNERDIRRYADSLQQTIRNLDEQHPSGWIVDLRDNRGGNFWPMIAGLGPLIENEDCGFFSTKGKYSKPIRYSQGAARLGKDVECRVSSPYTLQTRNKPMAVLVGKRTGSSGELVVVCLVNRPNTVVVGAHTRGLTTNNTMFTLSDGAVINLTTGLYADRSKKRYKAGIAPDLFEPSEEHSVNMALQWIQNRSDTK